MARNDLIQFRRGTAAQWTTANPVLAEGEMGFETDTFKLKIGDGAAAWSALTYINGDEVDASSWDSIINKPAVVAAGATQAAARTAIGAGTASTKSDVGLGNADNTSDSNKPVSTAQQTALDGKVTQVAGADTSSVFGSAIIKNTTRDWHGDSYNIGDVGNSFGWSGSPYVTPATTITADVTFPLFNATIPVADCAQLLPGGGSFLLGGKRVAYLGRSASSGAGNATGCYSTAAATGTVASGTAPVLSPTGFMALAVYKRFGYDGRPVVGSTQAFTAIAAYRSPTMDDSAEAGAFLVQMADSGSTQSQHNTVTGGEFTAQAGGNWLFPDGYSAALTGGGSRTFLSATDRAKNVIGFKVSLTHDAGSHVDNYDGIYQTASALQSYGTVNGAVSAGASQTVTFTGATVRPPTPTTGFPGSVIIGANANGVGGQVVTYTGITGSGTTGTLTGANVAVAIVSGARISNKVLGANLRDYVAGIAGFGLGDTGYSGAFSVALRGNTDSINSMLSLTGPTVADSVTGGLCQLRLNAGSDQTNSIMQVFDTAGVNRLSIGAAGNITALGQSIRTNTSAGVPTFIMGNTGVAAMVIAPTSITSAAGTTALNNASTTSQIVTGSTTQTITLPTTSVLQGLSYVITNLSTGNVTVNASGGGLVQTLTTGQCVTVMANAATPTTAAGWTITAKNF